MYGLSEESLTIVGIILIVVGVAMIGWGFEVLKGNSARHLFMFYPSLKDNLWGQQPRLNRLAGYRRGLRGNP